MSRAVRCSPVVPLSAPTSSARSPSAPPPWPPDARAAVATLGQIARHTGPCESLRHALHALVASLLADDRTVLADTDRWLTDLFTSRGHDPLLAPRFWGAMRETVGEFPPRARADLALLAPGK